MVNLNELYVINDILITTLIHLFKPTTSILFLLLSPPSLILFLLLLLFLFYFSSSSSSPPFSSSPLFFFSLQLGSRMEPLAWRRTFRRSLISIFYPFHFQAKQLAETRRHVEGAQRRGSGTLIKNDKASVIKRSWITWCVVWRRGEMSDRISVWHTVTTCPLSAECDIPAARTYRCDGRFRFPHRSAQTSSTEPAASCIKVSLVPAVFQTSIS